ncbi:hypothetical protein KI387_003268, partial [Taxus chinensis]
GVSNFCWSLRTCEAQIVGDFSRQFQCYGPFDSRYCRRCNSFYWFVCQQRLSSKGCKQDSLHMLRKLCALLLQRKVLEVYMRAMGHFYCEIYLFDALQFCLYEQLRIGYKLVAKRDLYDPENALIGAFAGALTGAITTPLDVIKTRLMVQGASRQYKGVFDCVQKIVQEEGPSALAK